jgi:hypothetical protein
MVSIEKDIMNCRIRLARLHDAYTKKLLSGVTTRAQTTTYNARVAALVERITELQAMIKPKE